MQSNLTLQQLRYITEVVECGSINAASQNLYVSQPALSTAIKDAEQELGIEIFNRSNRGITLTQEGVEFVGYAGKSWSRSICSKRAIAARVIRQCRSSPSPHSTMHSV